MSTRSERELAMMLSSFQNLGPALRRMREEKMAEELLGEHPTTYKLRRDVEDSDLDREYKRSQITRNLRERSDANDYRVPIELSDGRTVHVTPNEAATHDRRMNIEKPSSYAKIDAEVKAATGIPVASWRDAQNHRMEGGNFAADFTVPDPADETKTRTVTKRVPGHLYQKFLGDINKVEGVEPTQPYAEQVRPQVTGQKPLDKETAKMLLQEAGGDKEKARELARQRGFQF